MERTVVLCNNLRVLRLQQCVCEFERSQLISVCFQGPPGVTGIKGEVLKTTVCTAADTFHTVSDT